MPITFSFDIAEHSVRDTNDRTRIQAAFTRLGWESLGGSSWRYPALGTNEHASEDWFNHVAPALMYFRAIVEHAGLNVTKFTLDAHSEAGFRSGLAGPVGTPITSAADIELYEGAAQLDVLSARRLRRFIEEAATGL